MEAVDPFVFYLAIFVLAIFVGYYVVWSVTPALRTPLVISPTCCIPQSSLCRR
ncbi:MAG: proton-translocating transhydrogenase family protein [Hyphomonadaceae bacterium]